jgi:hypothetical protein
MKYRKLLLVAFVLGLFAVQQTHVGAIALSLPSFPSPLTAFVPPTNVYVTYYHLTFPDAVLIVDGHGSATACSIRVSQSIYDDTYGCTEAQLGGHDWSYPYPADPKYGPGVYYIPIETNYLPDVLSHEMDPHTYHNPQSEKAQAIASRTYVYYKISITAQVTNFGNIPTQYYNKKSPPANQTDIPYAFAVFLNNPNYPNNPTVLQSTEPGSSCQNTPNLTSTEGDVCNAISNTQGDYLAYNNSPIDAEFSNDTIGATIYGNQTCLQPIQDPISTACDSSNNGNLYGMSQLGANRWELGNTCSKGGGAAWNVKWSDYRQILTHYYTGVDLLSGSGSLLTPSDRWNLLDINNHTPIVMNAGATNTLNVVLQNTSKMTWNAGDIVVGYQWTPVGGATYIDHWQSEDAPISSSTSPSAVAGGFPQGINMHITPPALAGTYDLHLDVQHHNSSNWFSDGGWPDAKVSVSVNCPGLCIPITQASDDATVDPWSCADTISDNEIYLGKGITDTGGGNSCDMWAGFRFQNIPLSSTNTILSAYIHFTLDGPYDDYTSMVVYGDYSVNSTTFGGSVWPENRPPTPASDHGTWTILDGTQWNLGDQLNSPDLSQIIRDIVAQPGWAPGNSLSIIIKNNDTPYAPDPDPNIRRVVGYLRNLSQPQYIQPVLIITYQ